MRVRVRVPVVVCKNACVCTCAWIGDGKGPCACVCVCVCVCLCGCMSACLCACTFNPSKQGNQIFFERVDIVESISASEKSSTNRYVNRAGERLMIVYEERKKCVSVCDCHCALGRQIGSQWYIYIYIYIYRYI